MMVLAFDTSTPQGSVALWQGGEILFTRTFLAERRHTALLFRLLEEARALAPRPDLIAVGLGPGSYAGVRIAIAAGLGLSLASGARLVGLPSVAALAPASAHYFAVGDARRGTWYWSEVERGRCVQGPELVEEAEGQERCRRAHLPLFASEALPGTQLRYPRAEVLAELAAEGRGLVAQDDLEPLYLREAHITLPKAAGR